MAEDLMSYLDGREATGFEPRPFYSPDGDFLTFYFREDDHYAERVDELLTVYLSMDTQELVEDLKGRLKGDIAIHGRPLENLGKHRFLALGPVHMGGLPCLDLPERRPGRTAHPDKPGYPLDCESDFGRQTWPKTS